MKIQMFKLLLLCVILTSCVEVLPDPKPFKSVDELNGRYEYTDNPSGLPKLVIVITNDTLLYEDKVYKVSDKRIADSTIVFNVYEKDILTFKGILYWNKTLELDLSGFILHFKKI